MNVSFTFVLFAYVLLGALLFGLGIGFFVSIANAHYRDVGHLVTIGLNLLFFLTPIIYTFDFVPDRVAGFIPARTLIRANPVTQLVEAGRDVVYHLEVPSLARLAYITIVPLVVFTAGWLWFRMKSLDIAEEL